MNKKIYKLKPASEKYIIPGNSSAKPFYEFRLHVNKSRIQKALNARKKLVKKYKRPNSFVFALKLLAFYWALVGFIILLSKLGF